MNSFISFLESGLKDKHRHDVHIQWRTSPTVKEAMKTGDEFKWKSGDLMQTGLIQMILWNNFLIQKSALKKKKNSRSWTFSCE